MEQRDPLRAAPPHMLQVRVLVWLVGWFLGELLVNLYILGLLSVQSNVSSLTSRFMPAAFHLQRADPVGGAGWGTLLPQALHLTKFTAHPGALGGTRNLWRLRHPFPMTRVKVHQPWKSVCLPLSASPQPQVKLK